MEIQEMYNVLSKLKGWTCDVYLRCMTYIRIWRSLYTLQKDVSAVLVYTNITKIGETLQ